MLRWLHEKPISLSALRTKRRAVIRTDRLIACEPVSSLLQINLRRDRPILTGEISAWAHIKLHGSSCFRDAEALVWSSQ